MQGRFPRFRSVLVCALVALLLAWSFNAYACLLPVNGPMAAVMGNGCSTPDEPPVDRSCDVFKTLGVQSVDKLHPTKDSHATCSDETASLALLVALASHSSRLHDSLPGSPPRDLLLKISVLRI